MIQIYLILIITIFLTAASLNIVKKNFNSVILYALQSLAVSAMIFDSFINEGHKMMLLVFLLTFSLKVIVAPLFFSRLIKKHRLTFSATTYLSLPITLIIIATLTILTHSNILSALSSISKDNATYLSMVLAAILISIFMVVNRKGVISQMIGILSLENGIVAFAFFAGLEQFPGLEIGIIFNLCIWIVIATAFASMIYKQFGSLDVTTMKILKD